MISNFICNDIVYCLQYELLFMIPNFICDIKKYLISNIFYKKGIFLQYIFGIFNFFLYDMKHLFKELSFTASVVCMLTTVN